MIRKSRFIGGVLTAALLLGTAACGSGGDSGTGDTGPATTVAPVTTNGRQDEVMEPTGTLRVAIAAVEYQDYDPAQYKSGNQQNHIRLVFDTLLTNDPQSGEIKPNLATEWSLSSDTLSYTFKLRDDVKFHDESLMTAEDVKYSIERYLGSEAAPSSALGAARIGPQIDSIEVVSDTELVITMVAPGSATLLFDLAANPGSAIGYVVPKAVVEAVGDEAFNKAPVGSGPFRFVSDEPGRSMTYEAHVDYWAGAPGVGNLVMEIVPELTTRANMLRSGEVDIIDKVSGPAIDQVRGDSNLQLLASDQSIVANLWMGGQTNPDSPMSNADVRLALTLAIDRQGIIDTFLKGEGAPAALYHFPTSFGWPSDGDTLLWSYDPDRAKQLLADAGFGSGIEVELVAPVIGRDMAGAIAQNWRQVGIETTVTVVEQAAVLEDSRNPERQQATRVVMIWGPDGSPNRAEFSGAWGTWMSANPGLSQPAANPRVPELVAAQATERDPARRAAIIGELHQLAFKDVTGIGLWYINSLYGVSNRVSDWQVPAGMSYVQNLQTVRVAD